MVGSAAELLAALRSGEFDLAVGSPEALKPILESASPWHGTAPLENVDQAACVVDADGRIVWSNAALDAEPPNVVQAIRELCAAHLAGAAGAPASTGHKTISVGRERHFEVTLANLQGDDGAAAFVFALARNVTDARRMQERLAAIDAAGRALVDLDADALPEMDAGDRLELLQDRIVKFSRDLLHFDHFAIRILDPATNRLETALAGGFPEHAKSLPILAEAQGQGISGHVAATGKSYICDEVSSDPLYLPGLESARSSLTVPLVLHDSVIGIFNVESDKPAAFTETDRQFAEIFARYVAVALHVLNLLVVERRSTAGQIAADVDAETLHPMNDVVSGLTRLIERQPEGSELRSSLQAVLDDVNRLKNTLHSVTHPTGVSGLLPAAEEHDPIIGGKRVLVADDEDIIRETISDVLGRKGAVTVAARDGHEAVALVRREQFDLVLSDIKMPGKNGYEVFAAARESHGQTPVILITGFGYDPNHSIVRASREGLAGVLFKPFKVDQLLDQVRQALGAEAAK